MRCGDCGACAACDEQDFDAHYDLEERCQCDACRRVRARFEPELRPVAGGIASWALDALGLGDLSE